MKKGKKICLLLVLAVILLSGLQLVQEQKDLSSKLVRLHVVANSDTQADQQVKLQVRDAVLQAVSTLTKDCDNKEATVQCLQQSLPQLQQAAQDVLKKQGSEDAAVVHLQQEQFPTRLYRTFSLPAGTYTTLRVDLGNAAGHNWWCVVFPTLCTASETDQLQDVATAAGFSDDEIALITQKDAGYEIKFKVLEGFEKIKALFTKSGCDG